jgi:hypothetical protein
MYCTISHEEPSSTTLVPEALEAYLRLRLHARSFPAHLTAEAQAVTDAFARALAGGADGSWAAFVAAAAALVRRSDAGTARDFFAQIVRENGDLLTADAVALV